MHPSAHSGGGCLCCKCYGRKRWHFALRREQFCKLTPVPIVCGRSPLFPPVPISSLVVYYQLMRVVQGNVYVWRMLQNRDITSLIPVTSFQAHTAYVTRVLLSPDVRHLATCSADHNARIWSVDHTAQHNIKGNENLPTERQAGAFPLETSLESHQRWVWDCAFSADSAYLVTACSDHYARLWELNTQAVIRQYNGHHRGAVCVALNDYSETR